MTGRIPLWWDEAHAYLTKDELLGPVVEQFGPQGITSREDLFQTLVRSIVGQQHHNSPISKNEATKVINDIKRK